MDLILTHKKNKVNVMSESVKFRIFKSKKMGKLYSNCGTNESNDTTTKWNKQNEWFIAIEFLEQWNQHR